MKASTNPKLAIAYARCSTSMQDKSIDQQLAAIRRYAKASGLKLAGRPFADDGISGSESEHSRGALGRLLKHVASGGPKGTVIVWDRSRLSRADTHRAEALERKILATGWRLHFIHGHNATGDRTADAIVPTIERLANEEFLRKISRGSLRALRERFLAGGLVGGVIPYGFKKRITFSDGTTRIVSRRTKQVAKGASAELIEGDADEVATVRRIYKTYCADAVGLAKIAAQLNADGIPGPTGKRWVRATLQTLVKNPIYAGRQTFGTISVGKHYRLSADGDGFVEASDAHKSSRPGRRVETSWRRNAKHEVLTRDDYCPALVSLKVWERAQAINGKRGKAGQGRRKGMRSVYPLSGLMFCEACGGRFVGRNAGGGKYTYYQCTSYQDNGACAVLSVRAEHLEGVVLAQLQAALVVKNRAALRRKIVAVLKRKHADASATKGDVSKAKRRAAALEKRADAAWELALDATGASAKILKRKATAAGEELDRATARLEELQRTTQGGAAGADADAILALGDRLASLTTTTKTETRHALYHSLIARADVEFTVRPPTKRRKNPRNRWACGRFELAPAAATLAALLPADEAAAAGVQIMQTGCHGVGSHPVRQNCTMLVVGDLGAPVQAPRGLSA